MSRPHERFETAADYEAAKAFFHGSTKLNSVSNWGDGKYQIDGIGQVYLPSGTDLLRLHISEFVGGVAYSLAEQGTLPVEEANPNHVATVCFELGKLVSQHEVGHVSVGPLA